MLPHAVPHALCYHLELLEQSYELSTHITLLLQTRKLRHSNEAAGLPKVSQLLSGSTRM